MSHTKPFIAWRATFVIGSPEWHIVSPTDELIAIVLADSPSNGERVVINKTALLMADSPQILNELKHAHDILSQVFLDLMDREDVDYSLLKRLSSRASERLLLLDNHREFITNKECGHE